MLDYDHALSVAIEAAHAAGKVLKSHFGKKHTIQTKRSPRDLVTEVDREAQEVIIETILKAFPDHGFITEEPVGAQHAAPLQKNTHSPYQWVIDPLDGTTNFVHKKPLCGTNIALLEDATLRHVPPQFACHPERSRRTNWGGTAQGDVVRYVIVGVMFNPFSENLFTAKRGSGAFWNTKPIALRATRDMNDAILCCNINERAVNCNGAKHVPIPVCGSVQNYGCAMEEIAAVLRAENDGVFFDGVGLWDIAPGFLMIEEAGGRCRTEFKDPRDPRKGVCCVASTAPIFDDLCSFLFQPTSP